MDKNQSEFLQIFLAIVLAIILEILVTVIVGGYENCGVFIPTPLATLVLLILAALILVPIHLILKKKNQSSSLFKIVFIAFVFLFALLNFMSAATICDFPYVSPEYETNRLLGNAVDNPDSLMQTPEVAFKGGSTWKPTGLSAKSISEDTGISADQICMGLGDFADDTDFDLIAGEDFHRITYTGTSTKTVVIKVLCENDLDDLVAAISDYKLTGKINTDDCGICQDKGTCCAVILTKRWSQK